MGASGSGTLSSESGMYARSLGRLSFGRVPSLSAKRDYDRAASADLFIKAAISGAIVAAVWVIARRYPGWGGLVASLLLTSCWAILWLWCDPRYAERVAELPVSTIWSSFPRARSSSCRG